MWHVDKEQKKTGWDDDIAIFCTINSSVHFFYLSCEKPRQISGKHLQSQFVKALLGFVCLLSVQSSHYYSKALPISLPFWTSNVQ